MVTESLDTGALYVRSVSGLPLTGANALPVPFALVALAVRAWGS